MAAILLTTKVGGYEYIYQYFGTNRGMLHGIVIDPESTNFDDPDFIGTLQVACEHYKVYHAIGTLINIAGGDLRDIEIPRNFLAYVNELISLVDFHDWYSISDDIRHYARQRAESFDQVNDHMDAESFKIQLEREQRKKELVAELNEDRPIAPGYVYLLQSPTSAYKIGKTIDPDDRLRTFSVKLPFEVHYICLIETNNRHALESELHNRFASKRIDGEWFDLSDEDVKYIKSLAGVA